MRNVKRILAISLLLVLMMSTFQVALAAGASDINGVWGTKVKVSITENYNKPQWVFAKLVLNAPAGSTGGVARLEVSTVEGKSQDILANYTVTGNKIRFVKTGTFQGITVDTMDANVTYTYAPATKSKKARLAINGAVFGVPYAGNVPLRDSKVSSVSYKKVKKGNTTTLKFKTSPYTDAISLDGGKTYNKAYTIKGNYKYFEVNNFSIDAKKNPVTVTSVINGADGKPFVTTTKSFTIKSK